MKLKYRSSLLGIILGGICGLGGLLCGIYMGVVKPLQENGGTDKLPLQVIVTGMFLATVFIAYLVYIFLSHLQKKRNKPPEW